MVDCRLGLVGYQEGELRGLHRKNSALSALLISKELEKKSLRKIYRMLVLDPMLSYCQQLADFAEKHAHRVT